MAVGLAYNGEGGSVLVTECIALESKEGEKGKLVASGNLGEVIRYVYVYSITVQLCIGGDVQKNLSINSVNLRSLYHRLKL
jgi:hypothetical protein